MITHTLLTRAEAARMLRVHARTVDRWTREGRLPSVRITEGTVRYRLDQVVELIERAGTPAA